MLNIKRFTDWFHSQSSRLNSMPSDVVANEIVERLALLDDRLGVEVERSNGQGRRDIIITAFSDTSAFPIVFAIVDQLGQTDGWNVLALKPPMGFDFTVNMDGQKIQASTLRFRPISSTQNGFELLIPNVDISGEAAEEMAWLIAETGIGEKLTGGISHLEFGNSTNLDGSFPITDWWMHCSSKNDSVNNHTSLD